MKIFPKIILGIDFHDYAAEIVEIKQKGENVYMESFGREELKPDVIRNGEIKDPVALKKALVDVIKNANPKSIEGRDAAVLFPSSKVLTHIFTFPATLSEEDIRKSIPYEFEKVIPYSINDIYWDFSILSTQSKKEKHASQYVLFSCITKDVADRYAQILEEVGFNPLLFGIHPETLHYSLRRQLEPGKTTLIIDVESLSVNYLLVENGIIRYFFSIDQGGRKLMENMASSLQVPESSVVEKKEKGNLGNLPNIPSIGEFVNNNYKRATALINEQIAKKVVTKVDNILLTGEFLNLPQFFETAKKYFPNQKVSLGDPKLELIIKQEKFKPVEQNNETVIPYSIYFTNAIGIALRGLINGSGNGINLLPDRLKQSFKNRKNSFIISGIAVAMTAISLIIGTGFFFNYQNLYYDRLHLEAQKSAIEKILYGTRYQQIREEINTFNNEITALSKIDQGLFSLPNLLEEVKALIPRGVEISSIDFNDEDLVLGITGIADDRDILLKTQKNLENTLFASEVIAPRSNFDEKSKISFLLQIKLEFNQLPKYGTSGNSQ